MESNKKAIRDLIWKHYDASPNHTIQPARIARELALTADEISAELQKMVDEGWIQDVREIVQEQGPSLILALFASPQSLDRLLVDKEDKVITECIRLCKNRDRIELRKQQATTVDDMSRALLDAAFQIVHIAGHGAGRGVVLEDERGDNFVVPQGALARMFSRYVPPRGRLECVVLNACYSLTTGALTSSLGVPYTIAMEGPIGDAAAIEFSRGFYDAIGAGKGISFAYEEGCGRVALKGLDGHFEAKLLVRDEVNVASSTN
jgi:hypothetical protein